MFGWKMAFKVALAASSDWTKTADFDLYTLAL